MPDLHKFDLSLAKLKEKQVRKVTIAKMWFGRGILIWRSSATFSLQIPISIDKKHMRLANITTVTAIKAIPVKLNELILDWREKTVE